MKPLLLLIIVSLISLDVVYSQVPDVINEIDDAISYEEHFHDSILITNAIVTNGYTTRVFNKCA